MRIISEQSITDAVAALFTEACCGLPPEVLHLLGNAAKQENGHARAVLEQILENETLARKACRPCCQDTGLAVVFVDIGQHAHIDGDLYAAVDRGVIKAYVDGYMRKSALSALSRKNTGDNTPAIVHIRLIPGSDRVNIAVAPKGFGSENMSRLLMLKPAEGRTGVLAAIVETARLGAANACAPILLGVGIGGTMEAAALLAKRQLLRPAGAPSPDEEARSLEQEALEKINALCIGPMGLGGKTTALAVHVAQMPTHLAGLPVAINVQCHCARHAGCTL